MLAHIGVFSLRIREKRCDNVSDRKLGGEVLEDGGSLVAETEKGMPCSEVVSLTCESSMMIDEPDVLELEEVIWFWDR